MEVNQDPARDSQPATSYSTRGRDNEKVTETSDKTGSAIIYQGSPSRVEPVSYPSGTRLALVLTAVALSVFLVALDTSIISTAIPAITDEFHSLDDVGWYGSGFFITTAAFQFQWGKAYTYWPIKTVYLVAMFIFEVGSLVCAVAPNSNALIVGRAVAGIGAAGLATGTYLIVALSAPPKRVPALQGIVGASFAIASVIGPLLGGIFTSRITWRWCFYINLPIGGFTFMIVTFFFRTPAHAVREKITLREKLLRMDILGMLMILGSITCFLLALQWAGLTKPWSSSPVIGTFVASGVMAIAFVLLEIYLGERASLKIRLLKKKTIALMMTYQFLLNGSFFVLLYYLPIYFQSVKLLSASDSGVRTIPLVVPCALSAIISGAIITFVGEFQVVMIIGAILAAIGSGLVFTLGGQSDSGMWIGYQIICGVGVGLGAQIAVIVAQVVVDPEDLSIASAIAVFFQLLGGAVWVGVAQSLFLNRLIQSLKVAFPGLSNEAILSAGATGLKGLSPIQLQAAVQSYTIGLRATYTLSIAVAGTAAAIAVTAIILDRRRLNPAAVAVVAA